MPEHPFITNRKFILALARSFPCLRGKVAHLTPETWDVDRFMEAAATWSTVEYLSAVFVAQVWNPGHAKGEGWEFDLMRFMGNADRGNRRAFVEWCANPRWP